MLMLSLSLQTLRPHAKKSNIFAPDTAYAVASKIHPFNFMKFFKHKVRFNVIHKSA
jgi:hypothetical protein